VDEGDTTPQELYNFSSFFSIEISLQIQYKNYPNQKSSNYKVVGFHLEILFIHVKPSWISHNWLAMVKHAPCSKTPKQEQPSLK